MINLPQSAIAWADDLGASPISHGQAAEALLISAIDVKQISAMWSIPHFVTNCFIPRGSTTVLPVVVPPLVDRLRCSVIAAGEGTVSFNGANIITVEGDSSALDLEDAQHIAGGTVALTPFVGTSGDTIVSVTIGASANVVCFALGFIYERSVNTLINAY